MTMKKTSLSADEKKIRQHENSMPKDINVSKIVMNHIYDKQKKRTFLSLPKRAAAIALSSLVLLTGAVTYATGLWEITDKNGEVLLEAEKLNELSYIVERFNHDPNKAPTPEELEAQAIYTEVRETLADGEYAYVFINDEQLNPNQEVVEVINEKKIADYNELNAALEKNNFPNTIEVPKSIDKDYQFVEGGYRMLGINTQEHLDIQEALKVKSKQTDNLVVMKKFPIEHRYTNEPQGIHVTLSNGEDTIYYIVERYAGLKLFVSNEAKVEKLVLGNGVQVIYVNDDKDGYQMVQTVKMENDVRTTYSVRVPKESNLTKAELIKVAESIIK